MLRPDPKPRKRITDSAAVRAKLGAESICRSCEKRSATDGHHIVLRSQGGDDVADNIVPLCHECHMRYHNAELSIRISARELSYVYDRLGRRANDYLKRRRVTWS